jgi:hypothetical protein
VNPSIYVEIVFSCSLNNPGTLSEASWLHCDRFLWVAGIVTSVVEEQDRILGRGEISICVRISIASEGLENAGELSVWVRTDRRGFVKVGELTLEDIFSLNLVILFTSRKIVAGLL